MVVPPPPRDNRVYLNDETGNFSTVSLLNDTSPARSFDISVVDVDANGELDLIFANKFLGAAQLFLGQEDGSYISEDRFDSLGLTQYTTTSIADLNGDGIEDILFGSNRGNKATRVLLGTTPNRLGGGAQWNDTTLALTNMAMHCDLDGDGWVDIYCANTHRDEILYNRGGGQFYSHLIGNETNTSAVACADLDGDGQTEIILATQFNDDGSNTVLEVLVPDGAGGGYTPRTMATLDATVNDITIADLDRDGRLELVIATADAPRIYNATVEVWHYERSNWLPWGANSSIGVSVADLDADGTLDLMFASDRSVALFYGDANGSFNSTPDAVVATGMNLTAIAVGDIDRDGWYDIVVGGDGGATTYLNNCSGGFGTATNWSSLGQGVMSCALGDLDRNGALDLALGYGNGTVELFAGMGNGSCFHTRPIWSYNSSGTMAVIRSMLVAPVDHDALPDLFIAGEGANRLHIHNGVARGNAEASLILDDMPPTDELIFGRLNFSARLFDVEMDRCDIFFSYILEGNRYNASLVGHSNPIRALAGSQFGTDLTFQWDTDTDDINGEEILFEIVLVELPTRVDAVAGRRTVYRFGPFDAISNTDPRFEGFINTTSVHEYSNWSITLNDYFDDDETPEGLIYSTSSAVIEVDAESSVARWTPAWDAVSLVNVIFIATDPVNEERFARSNYFNLEFVPADKSTMVTINTPDGEWVNTSAPLVDVDFRFYHPEHPSIVIEEVSYRLNDETAWTLIEAPHGNYSDDLNITGLREGLNTVYFQVIDSDGGEYRPTDSNHTLTLSYDSTAPTFQIPSQAQWYNTTTPTLTVECYDDHLVESIWYCVDNGPWYLVEDEIGQKDRSATFELDEQTEGEHTVRFLVYDRANNSVHSTDEDSNFTLWIDLAAPQFSIANASGAWHRTSTIHIAINCTDDLALAEAYYEIQDGFTGTIFTLDDLTTQQQRYRDPLLITGLNEGSYNIRFTIYDRARNSIQTSFTSFVLNIDRTAPSIQLTQWNDTGTTGEAVWVNGSVRDAGSGVAIAQLTYRQGTSDAVTIPFSNGTAAIPLEENSTASISFSIAAVDIAGNHIRTGNETIRVIDNDDPHPLTALLNETFGTGNPFILEARFSDNIGVGSAELILDYETLDGQFTSRIPIDASGAREWTFAMNDTALFDATNGRFNSSQAFFCHFYLTVEDAAGGRTSWGTAEMPNNLTFIDDDAPTLVKGPGHCNATTGDEFSLEVEVTDNIWIDTVMLNISTPGPEAEWYMMEVHENFIDVYEFIYWFDADENFTTIVPGVYPYEIIVLDWVGNELVYRDGDDPWTLTVTDNDPPLIHENFSYVSGDRAGVEVLSGEPFEIGVDIDENGELVDVTFTLIDPAYEQRWTVDMLRSEQNRGGILSYIVTYEYLQQQIDGFTTQRDTYYEFYITVADAAGHSNRSEQFILLIQDADAPEISATPFFFETPAGEEVTTGDEFTLFCAGEDPFGIERIVARLTFDNATWYTMEMNRTSMVDEDASQLFRLDSRRLSEEYPQFSTFYESRMYLNFTLYDTANLTNTTDDFCVEIYDNDPPVLSDYPTRIETYTGEEFEIGVTCVDNMEVEYVSVILRGGGGQVAEYDLYQRSSTRYSINYTDLTNEIAWFDTSAGESFSYWFSAGDIEENENETSGTGFTIEVTDNIPPHVAEAEVFPQPPTTGDPFVITARCSDNVGLALLTLNLTMPNGTATMLDFALEGERQTTLTISYDAILAKTDGAFHTDALSTLEYSITVYDERGYPNRSRTYSRTIIDNDPPVIRGQTQGLAITSGDTFSLNATVEDNRAVGHVYVRLYDTDDRYLGEVPMVSDDGVHYDITYEQLTAVRGFSTAAAQNYSYEFECVDENQNQERSARFWLDNTDNDAPEFDEGPGALAIGPDEGFVLEVAYHDNVRPTELTVHFRTGENGEWNAYAFDLTASYNVGALTYTADDTSCAIPKGTLEDALDMDFSSGDYYYYLTISDGNDNTARYGSDTDPYKLTVTAEPVNLLIFYILIPIIAVGSVVGFLVVRRLILGGYRVEQVYLIYDDGCLIRHLEAGDKDRIGKDQIAAMFTAIQDFVRDSFKKETEGLLDELKFEDLNIIFHRKDRVIMAVIIDGYPHPEIRRKMKRQLEKIYEEYGDILEDWNGALEDLDGVEKYLAEMLPGKDEAEPESSLMAGEVETETETETEVEDEFDEGFDIDEEEFMIVDAGEAEQPDMLDIDEEEFMIVDAGEAEQPDMLDIDDEFMIVEPGEAEEEHDVIDDEFVIVDELEPGPEGGRESDIEPGDEIAVEGNAEEDAVDPVAKLDLDVELGVDEEIDAELDPDLDLEDEDEDELVMLEPVDEVEDEDVEEPVANDEEIEDETLEDDEFIIDQ